MKVLTTIIARILYGLPMIIFGIIYLIVAGQIAGYVPSWIPGGVFWVYVAGLVLLFGGVAIIIRKAGKPAALLLAALLMFFVLAVHVPTLASPDELKFQLALTDILKDVALAGAALTYAGMFSRKEGDAKP